MAKIFYVRERSGDYTQVNFFKTEKEALEYGISEWPNFDMFGDQDSEEDSYDVEEDAWWVGDSIDIKKGVLFYFEEGMVYVEEMDDDSAREYVKEDLGSDGAALFFESFKKGMYGYLGNGADGRGYKWEWTGSELDESIQERNIIVKRKYTENHPAKSVGKAAKIRNKMLEAAADGKITPEEFNTILREMSTDTSRWIRRNSKFFSISEKSVSLSKTGKRILDNLNRNLVVNERASIITRANAKAEEIFGEFGIVTLDYDQLNQVIDVKKADKLSKKYGEDSFMSLTEIEMEELLEKNPRLLKENTSNIKMETPKNKTTFVYESFSEFVNSLSNELVTEAFGSQRLAELFRGKSGKLDKHLASAFYGSTKVALDKVQDEDLITTDPQTAYKAKQSNSIIFYISDNEKENPHAPYDAYVGNKTIPGGGYLLAVTSGGNKFYDQVWSSSSRYGRGKNKDRNLKAVDNNPTDSIGIGKKYKGWDATGLYNVKRIAEVADRAIVINVDLLQQKYSTANKRSDRAAAKSGATAFKSHEDFKSENKKRYETILANNAAKLPLDKMVSDAIDVLTAQIQNGLKKGEKTKYGEIMIGTNKRGSVVKLRDASNHMSNILDDYSRYCDYVRQGEESKERYGAAENWYERETKNYAKNIKDRINKIKTFDYAW